ncbi:MAG: hypothetical protein WCL08_00080 [Verrucomicrobiota bacterium]
MSKRLRDQQFTPPGGWRYEEPSTGQAFSAITKRDLVNAVRKHRMSKNIPIGNLELDVEAWLCAKIPAGKCEESSEVPLSVKESWSLSDVRSFAESVAFTLKNGGVVSSGEATRRAEICVSCKLNTTVKGCTGCSGISTFIFSIMGARKTPYDSQMKQCGACGCPLAAKVWITKPDLESRQQVQDAMDTYPAYCWMKQEARG